MTRNPFLWPFAATSPWNLPIANAATFEEAADAKTATLLRPDLTLWINQWKYSIPVYRAGWADPVAKVTDRNWSARNASFRIPPAAEIAQGTDRNLFIVEPDWVHGHDMWSVVRNSPTDYNVGRHEQTDLKKGGGWGPRGGARAAGCSTLGGLIRDWEIDPTHPNYTGVIRHALAVAIDVSMLHYAGGSTGYTSDGYGRSLGYVWPATEQDSNASSVYKGPVPMGSYFAIPPAVDLSTLGLSPQGLMLAKAFQDYGAYVVDGTYGSVSVYVQANASLDWRGAVINAGDLGKLRSLFRIVTNNTKDTPNGGPVYSPRRGPIAPYL